MSSVLHEIGHKMKYWTNFGLMMELNEKLVTPGNHQPNFMPIHPIAVKIFR